MRKIAISAGELSGDEHAASLVRALRLRIPTLEVRGMGGRNLRAAGVELIVDCETHGSIMGFQEVLFAAKRVFASWASMRKLLSEWKPSALILVDYPDFNLRLASAAKKLGIKVFYFIPPKVWAWRAGRTRLFSRLIDGAAVIFPFEPEFFRHHGYDKVAFVGHPFADQLKRFDDLQAERSYRELFLLGEGLDPNHPVVALFPGSRSFEIKKHIGLMIAALCELQKKHPKVQAILSIAPSVEHEVQAALSDFSLNLKAIAGKPLDILRCADAGLLKSGTSNLQAAFYGLPFVMFYVASPFAEFIVRNFVQIEEYSPVNVVRPGTVPELIQLEATSENAAHHLEQLLFDSDARRKMKDGLSEVQQSFASFEQYPEFQDAEFQDTQDAYGRAAAWFLSTTR